MISRDKIAKNSFSVFSFGRWIISVDEADIMSSILFTHPKLDSDNCHQYPLKVFSVSLGHVDADLYVDVWRLPKVVYSKVTRYVKQSSHRYRQYRLSPRRIYRNV